MDLIKTPQRVTALPVNYGLIQAAGEPGSPQRLMVTTALSIASRPTMWRRGGRGPTAYDWMGFVLECAHETRWSIGGHVDTPDADLEEDARLSPPHAMLTGIAVHLFMSWGMLAIPFEMAAPGDILLFAMPGPYAAIMTKAYGEGEAEMASVQHLEPARVVALSADWRRKATCAFTWAY